MYLHMNPSFTFHFVTAEVVIEKRIHDDSNEDVICFVAFREGEAKIDVFLLRVKLLRRMD